VDKGPHGGVPQAVEPEEIHFFYGFFSRPFLRGDAISGDENAGAVLTEAAVHEDFLPRIIVEKREKLDDLFVGWGRPAIDGDVNKAHAQQFGALTLPFDFFAVLGAQIDDGGNAQHFQLREAYFVGLRAAIQDIRDFPGFRNAGDVEFLSVGGRNGRRGGGWSSGLREKRKRENKKEGKRWQSVFHVETNTSSVA